MEKGCGNCLYETLPGKEPPCKDCDWYNVNWKPQATQEKSAESDPNGIDAHTPGAKLDAGKPRVELVLSGFALALLEVVKVGTYGANKYTDNGWKQVKNGIERYGDASGRHMLTDWSGEKIDPETGLRHKAQKIWNDLASLQLELLEEKKNNA